MMKSPFEQTGSCSTWNIFLRDRLLVRTDRADSPILVTHHTVNGHLAGQEGAGRLRVVQLTDLHLHPGYPLKKLRRLAALVNAQRPDLIVFTGDFLRHSGLHPLPQENSERSTRAEMAGRSAAAGCRDVCPQKMSPAGMHGFSLHADAEQNALAILRGMKARYGKLAVRGNHDLRGNHRQVPFYLEKAGFRLLRNEQTVLCLPNGRQLMIAGLDDGAYHLADPRAVRGLRKQEGFRLVLAHEPMLARLVPPGAAELVLAGHTHAGQFWAGGVQRLWMPMLTGGHFAGWRAVNGNPLYVSAGLGESGLGLRILCPAELPVFDCWMK